MRNALIILNPVAGKGKGINILDELEKTLKENNISFTVKISKYKNEIKNIVSEFLTDSHTDIITIGGDGTVLESIQGVLTINRQASINIGIIPAGTGNDLIKSLGISSSIEEAIRTIVKINEIKKIDIGLANDKIFLNVCSLGIDTNIVKDAARIKKYVSGKIAYGLGALKAILLYKPKMVTIEIDGKLYKRKVFLVAIGNGKYFGGGMKITPSAVITDGMLDICVINETQNLKLFKYFPMIFKGTHVDLKIVETFRGSEIKVYSSEDLYINTDGNIMGSIPVHIKISSDKVNVIC